MFRKLKLAELNRLTIYQYRDTVKQPVIVLLDNVRSMHNVGSVFRTCDAFNIEALYLCGITGTPPHREIHKTALGAEDSVLWQHFTHTRDACMKLKSEGYTLLAVEQAEGSRYLSEVDFKEMGKFGLIFGNEVSGVSDDVLALCDACVEIPQFGTKHSFNIAVSAGIVLWEAMNQLNPPPAPSKGGPL